MSEDTPNSLQFETTESLISELVHRHTGDGRALVLISCTPVEGGIPGQGELRTVFIGKDKNLLNGVIAKGFEMVREQNP